MAFTQLFFALFLSHQVAAQAQNVQFNQVVTLNGNMALNTLTFPDNTKIETFSQTMRQMIVNQNPAPLSANHVVGSTGQPFVQITQNSMTIETNNASDLVGAQIEMPIDPAVLGQMTLTSDNTFVAKLSDDRQAWIIMEDIKNVNVTDNTVRMIKMNNIDGEYMAVGRQTVETANVVTPFGSDNVVQIQGSGLQEVEFTDGFRMTIKATQQMSLTTDVVNGVSSSMTTSDTMSVNNYRYLVRTSLGGVIPDLNNMVAVVQVPMNAARVMQVAQNMGATADTPIAIGVAQRVVLANPGGAQGGNLGAQKKRQATSTTDTAAATDPAATATTAAADPNAATTTAATDPNATTAATDPNVTTAVADPNAATTTAVTDPNVQVDQGTTSLAGAPVATQLLLSPTFVPLTGDPILDTVKGRIAIPADSLDGEFILTMAMAGAPGTVPATPGGQVGQGAVGQGQTPATPGEAQQQGQIPAAAGAATGQIPANGSATAAEELLAGGARPAKRQAAAAPGTIVMTMAQLSEMAARQATGNVIPTWSMMSNFVAQRQQQVAARAVSEKTYPRRRGTPLKV